MTSNASRYRVLLTSLTDLLSKELSSLAARPLEEHELVVLMYHGRLLEHARALCILADHHCWSSLTIILRTMMEVRVKQLNVIQDPRVVDELRLKDIESWIKARRESQNVSKHFNEMFQTIPDYVWNEHASAERANSIKATGVASQQIKTMFERVGLAEMYIVYGMLSGDCHGQLGSVAGKHLDFPSRSLSFFAEETLEDNVAYIFECVQTLVGSALEVHHRLGVPASPDLLRLETDFKSIGGY